ncbi:peptidase M6 [Vibrio owensii]|uniref:M6 family metalloprotease domain-containing protein n=1 Tax=Vibrio owensii TaxID=696485 RepID=UPI0003A7222F|nr:M6 family metalloprotease domain-containing protein [Vibrio owensii]SUP92554.1 peptidase M6 [Vibrio owensii]
MKFKTLALTMLATVISGQSMATTPPSPVWQPVTLSDGTSSDIILRGTAAFHWHEDKQGNALIKKDGHWFFAEIKRESDSPILVSTGVEKTQSTSAPEASQLRPSVLVKPALSSLRTIEPRARANLMRQQAQGYRAMSSSGVTEQPLLVVEVSFNDQKMVHDFQQLVFGENRQSVVDFYDKNSKGQYRVVPANENYGTTNDGVISVTVNQNHPDCHSRSRGNDCEEKTNAVFTEAYQKLDQYINLAQYDADDSGSIDPTELSVMFIFAGGDMAANQVDRPSIWPHKFHHYKEYIDGVSISEYCLFADFQLTHQSTLGVIVHELGHLMLGLPDLYSYSGTGSIGEWGVMGSGSWSMKPGDRYAGDTPVNMSAWSKHAAGFVTPDVAQRSNVNASVKNGQVKLVYLDPYLKESGPRVYLENRTLTDYDRALAGEGTLVTSVNILNRFNDEGEMQVQIMQADGLGELETFWGKSDSGDLYPNGGISISDFSYPSLEGITGYKTDVTISNIDSTAAESTFSLEMPSEPNKSAWQNSFYRGFIYPGSDDALAIPIDLEVDSELDGLQLFASTNSESDMMSYKVWRFPVPAFEFYDLLLQESDAQLLQEGAFDSSSRIIFDQPSQLSAGKHLILVEIEGGLFERNFNIGSELVTEISYWPNMWAGLSRDIYSSGLEQCFLSCVPFAALFDVDASSIVEAKSDAIETDKNVAAELNLMSNDFIAPGYQFSVEYTQQPTHGTINDDQYVPKTNFVGSDSFQYRLVSSDGSLSSQPVTVQVTVNGQNDAPTASVEADTSSMSTNGQGSLSAASSTDPDGDALEYVWQQTAGTDATLSDANKAEASFTVAQGTKAGEVLTFQVTVKDPSGLSSTANVDVEVVNTAPITTQDVTSVEEGKSITIDVLSNDYDFNNDSLTLQSVNNPSGVGTASVVNGKVLYQAPDEGVANVQLQYTVSDGNGGTATGSVNVSVVASVNSVSFESSDSGGSVSYWALMLLALLGWRRRA